MLHDSLKNFRKYQSFNPRFSIVADWLEKTDLNALECGKHSILMGDVIFANVQEIAGRKMEDIPVESHKKYVDVQIPLSGPEVMGWLPAAEMLEEPYNEVKDVTLTRQAISSQVTVRPGEFVVFTPDDAHAPGCVECQCHRKIIIKILK